MPVYGYQLMSVRCLVTGKYAELKRQDGMSEEPGIFPLLVREKREVTDKTRFKLNKVCLIRSQYKLSTTQTGRPEILTI